MNHILLNKIIHYLCLSFILLIPTGIIGLYYTGYFVGIVLAIAIFKSEGIKRTYIIGTVISVISVIVSIPILNIEKTYYSSRYGQWTNENGDVIREDSLYTTNTGSSLDFDRVYLQTTKTEYKTGKYLEGYNNRSGSKYIFVFNVGDIVYMASKGTTVLGNYERVENVVSYNSLTDEISYYGQKIFPAGQSKDEYTIKNCCSNDILTRLSSSSGDGFSNKYGDLQNSNSGSKDIHRMMYGISYMQVIYPNKITYNEKISIGNKLNYAQSDGERNDEYGYNNWQERKEI